MLRSPLLQVVLGVGLIVLGFAAGLASAGSLGQTPEPPQAAPPTLTRTSTAAPTATFTPPPSETPAPTSTVTSTQTAIPSLTPDPSFAIGTPGTPQPLRARVLEQANCRYGPGAAYLYEWGLYLGDRVDVIGRNDLGTWVYVDPWTYFDRCWVKTSLLSVEGDVYSLPPYYGRLPFSELYLPPTNVRATRMSEDEVWVVWDAVWMTEDDYRGYLIEAWLCQDGQLIFTPVQIDGTSIILRDEPGCVVPSGGRLYTAEKHGYTQWVLIPWPANLPPEKTPDTAG